MSLRCPFPLRLSSYTAIAEKFQVMVVLDMTNSRMKDFYDICVLFRSFTLDAEILATAVRRTFERPFLKKNRISPVHRP
ncbi:MAG: nucleotidyl transferase AbiEii/AbiGii toxin family protein [Fibrobacteria bacterium]